MTDLLTAALDYAARGWPVFPLAPRTKQPTKGSRGFKDATTDAAKIRRWWAETPNANVGLVTGPDSGLLVLDIDPRNGGDDSLRWVICEAHGDLPRTVEARTGGGGAHCLFRCPPGARATKAATGVDVKAAGGYIVAPPSIHPSGDAYRWVPARGPGEITLAEPPRWLVDLVTEAHQPKPAPARRSAEPDDEALRVYVASALDAAERNVRGAAEGERNNTLNAEAYSLGTLVATQALSYDRAKAVLFDAARAAGLEEREIRRTLASGLDAGDKDPRDLSRVGLLRRQAPPPLTDDDAPPGPSRDGAGVPLVRAPVEIGEGRLGDKPTITINKRQLEDVVTDAWSAVRNANDPPSLFRRGINLVQVVGAGTQREPMAIDTMTEDALFAHLSASARWQKLRVTKGGDLVAEACAPWREVAKHMRARPVVDLPYLDQIATTPLVGADGGVLTRRGYHPDEALWLDADLRVEVPDNPTSAQVSAARSLLLDELLVDFPFVAAGDKAHALAAILCPFARRLINGPTPLHLIEAPTPGSGKGLIANAVSILSTGHPATGRTLPTVEEEVRKAITAELSAGRSLILLDNAEAHRTLNSAALASALTASTWTDRLLGQSAMLTLPVRATWLLTGNNPRMSMELARRCIRVRIDPKHDRPWRRKDSSFRHHPLEEWAEGERGALVSACLTLIRAWVAASKPPGTQTLGSFESWARTIGGILDVAGVPGFLGNLDSLYEEADAEGSMWREFVTAWWDRHGSAGLSVGELTELCRDRDCMLTVIGDKSERSQSTRLGVALRGARDRVFGEHCIRAGRDGRTKRPIYSLIEVVG